MYVGSVVFGAASRRWLYSPSRLRGRALAKYVAAIFLLEFWARQWLRPAAARRDAAREQLRAELEREPTDDEMYERLTGRPRYPSPVPS